MKPVSSRAEVAIDFARLADFPVSHDRIALFNSGLVTADTYRRDSEFFLRTHPEHLRIDLGWGAEWMPWKKEVVTYTDGEPHYDFEETDEIAGILNGLDVRPYWSYSYVPAAVRRPGTDWRTLAENNNSWVDLVRAYVVGASERGIEIGYHEVYNEPDLRDERTAEPVFFAGDLDDYLELYRQTAPAIREADPGARIGGPALASVAANAHWLRLFLDTVAAEDLPLDFLSFHHYGTFGLKPAVQTVLEILESYPQFGHVELHLNEYNSFTIDYPQGGLQDGPLLAAAFVQDVEFLLSVPRLTRVSWAQFLDSGNDNYSGMVTINGAAKPLYSAYEFLQQMPVDRVSTSVVSSGGIGVIASGGEKNGAAIIYNRSSGPVTVTLTESNAPGERTLRLIDTKSSSDRVVSGNEAFELERGATALVSYGDRTHIGTQRIVTRTRYAFEPGCEGWADVDETTATVRLGTGTGAGAATVRIGLDLPSDVSPEFVTSVTYADGSPAAGEVVVETSARSAGTTVWLTLIGAPAHAFAIARPRETRS